jgi:hypothetical protein
MVFAALISLLSLVTGLDLGTGCRAASTAVRDPRPGEAIVRRL